MMLLYCIDDDIAYDKCTLVSKARAKGKAQGTMHNKQRSAPGDIIGEIVVPSYILYIT